MAYFVNSEKFIDSKILMKNILTTVARKHKGTLTVELLSQCLVCDVTQGSDAIRGYNKRYFSIFLKMTIKIYTQDK